MTDRKEEMGRLADRASRKHAETDETDEHADEADTPDRENAATETDASGETDAPSDEEPATDGSDETTETTDDPETETETVRHVKERPSVYMYLPKEYGKDLDIACQMINLTYQRETGDKLPKNRYLYPIVTKVGHENAADLSFEEIQTLKDEIDEIDATETEP
jgi:hypothetical protein